MATLFLFPDVENFKSFVNFVFDECPSFFFCVISVTLLFFFGLLCDNFYDDLCLLYYAMSNRTENLKRKRDPTFVASEKMALVDLVEKHFAIVECKKTDATTIRSKNQEWQKIAEEFNSVSSVHPREWIVLKNCWENLKKRAKSEQTARNQHYLGTGGGPPRKLTVDPAIDRVLDLIQTRVSGFVNVYDSDGTHILASGNNPSTSVADQAPQNDILLYSNDASATPVLDVQDSTEAAVVTETAAATFEVDWSQYTPAMLRAPVTTALVASRSPSPEATGSRVEPPPHKRTTITPPRVISTERPIATASRRRPILRRESLNAQRINTLLNCNKNADEEHAANMAILRLQEQREEEMLVQEKLKTEQEKIKLEILKIQLKKLQDYL